MSIIIKGMAMPKWEDGKELTLRIMPDGTVIDINGNRNPDAEAKELPTHGRLIDADALEEEPCDVVENMEWYSESGYSHIQIQNAPTIIEAEEAEQ